MAFPLPDTRFPGTATLRPLIFPEGGLERHDVVAHRAVPRVDGHALQTQAEHPRDRVELDGAPRRARRHGGAEEQHRWCDVPSVRRAHNGGQRRALGQLDRQRVAQSHVSDNTRRRESGRSFHAVVDSIEQRMATAIHRGGGGAARRPLGHVLCVSHGRGDLPAGSGTLSGVGAGWRQRAAQRVRCRPCRRRRHDRTHDAACVGRGRANAEDGGGAKGAQDGTAGAHAPSTAPRP